MKIDKYRSRFNESVFELLKEILTEEDNDIDRQCIYLDFTVTSTELLFMFGGNTSNARQHLYELCRNYVVSRNLEGKYFVNEFKVDYNGYNDSATYYFTLRKVRKNTLDELQDIF